MRSDLAVHVARRHEQLTVDFEVRGVIAVGTSFRPRILYLERRKPHLA